MIESIKYILDTPFYYRLFFATLYI